MKVTFPNPSGIFKVDSFEARIQNGTQKCNVLVAVVPRECSITGLLAGTLFTVLAVSSGDGVQSVPVEILVYTWPQGNHASSWKYTSVSIINNYISLTLAPTKVEIVQVTTTVVTAKAIAPAGNTGIEYFEASVVDGPSSQKCTVNKSDEPHQCAIKNLTPNTDYTISMRACLPDSSGCSPGVTTNTRTLPHRTLVLIWKAIVRLSSCDY